MNLNTLYKKAQNREFLSKEEGVFLYKNAPLENLMFIANQLRKTANPNNIVGWIIDRNVNITNVCVSHCKFCNFYRKKNSDEAYITTIEEYREKIKTLFDKGGNQLLLQGGLHPKLGLQFYTDLFKQLKQINPNVKLHALGPPEIAFISKIEKLSYKEVLEKLTEAGLDSLPGAGAEILSDRVRKRISPGKCDAQTWLDVMREAHKLNITTSATMMFGHIETIEERIEHFIKLREVQAEKPDYSDGFTAFIPWPFQDKGTKLKTKEGIANTSTQSDYIRTIAISRIMMPNIKNIQASWLTVGKETGQICLMSGANDFGSIMIEENVVSAAGATNKFDAKGIQEAIREAGFTPKRRSQKYEYIEEKSINGC